MIPMHSKFLCSWKLLFWLLRSSHWNRWQIFFEVLKMREVVNVHLLIVVNSHTPPLYKEVLWIVEASKVRVISCSESLLRVSGCISFLVTCGTQTCRVMHNIVGFQVSVELITYLIKCTFCWTFFVNVGKRCQTMYINSCIFYHFLSGVFYCVFPYLIELSVLNRCNVSREISCIILGSVQ